MYKTIDINNRDTFLHIDTYSMFTLDNEQELIAEGIMEDDPSIDFDNLDDRVEFEYNMDQYRDALANASVEFAKDNFVIPDTASHDKSIVGVITDIQLVAGTIGSPKYYNYTTDYYTATWSYDPARLLSYAMKNKDKYLEFLKDNWSSIDVRLVNNKLLIQNYNTQLEQYDHTPVLDHEDSVSSMIDFFTRQSMVDSGYKDYEDTYFTDMLDKTNESAYECIEYKLINNVRSNK